MYPSNTLNYLTDGLRNVFYNNEKASKYQLSDSLCFEWSIENNQIKHVEYADYPVGDGSNGNEIIMAFVENYYQKFDIFRDDTTKQQFQVMSRPVRKSDHYWEVRVRIVDNNFDTLLDTEGCQPGLTTTWQSTANVELSEEGIKILRAFLRYLLK